MEVPGQTVLDDLPHQDTTLAQAITVPCKHPIDASGIHPNSTALVHEDQYSETVEDAVEGAPDSPPTLLPSVL
ncbi:uncharacterized protein EI90DRAFT_3118110 [Cantharellus anzutake]|uniref:uncharacterized protein n=1 Tax=Cantharellus anzutake TaxID=1750568 RepID=UPI001902C344|nr:uncharacterized protein EI90DRAFT_3118110 [Cantharellus anzutake]KAF8339052.1 hypothetical protein EI90DRAFT_3118110 [Cantharellus anzutake]